MATLPAESGSRVGLSSYERGVETAGERYEREIRRLEGLFSTGRLSSKELEMAKENLRNMSHEHTG